MAMIDSRNIRLFAGAREAVGNELLCVDVPTDATAAQILAAIGAAAPELAGLLPACRLVADESYVESDQIVSADSDLALIPPVSGG